MRRDATRVFLVLRGSEAFLFAMIFAATMVYMVEVGLDPFELVLVGTAVEGTILLFEVPTGVVADRVSRRLSIVIGLLLTGGAYTLMGLVPSFVAIATASALWGLGYTFTSGATEAWIVDEVGRENAEPLLPRSEKISGLLRIAGTLTGMGLGAVRIQAPIAAGGVLFGLLAVTLAVTMPEAGFSRRKEEPGVRSPIRPFLDTARAGIAAIRGTPLLIALILAELLFGAHSEGFDRLRDAHLIRSIGVPGAFPPVVWLGGIGILTGLLVSAGNVVTERRVRSLDRPGRPLAALTTVAAVAIVAFALTTGFPLAAVLVVCVGVTRGVAGPILSIWLNRHIPSEVRATVLSMWGQADAAGQILLGPLVGLLGRATDMRPALTVSGLVLVPTIAVYLWAALRRNGRMARQT